MDANTRRSNRRLGLILGSIALAFFVGVMIRLGLFGG
ncbi:cytochrome oxidase small assembly protein [Chitinimonas lacunae]|uniref:Cytochrome oxidase small assembly protein n=1 Tax=Chitinimonas lacunae TaxID=1963018 RepID=A0ABV8MQY1_9NEIS